MEVLRDPREETVGFKGLETGIRERGEAGSVMIPQGEWAPGQRRGAQLGAGGGAQRRGRVVTEGGWPAKVAQRDRERVWGGAPMHGAFTRAGSGAGGEWRGVRPGSVDRRWGQVLREARRPGRQGELEGNS